MNNFIKKLFRSYFRRKEKECKDLYLWYETYYSYYPEYEKTLAFRYANLANEIGKMYGNLAKALE